MGPPGVVDKSAADEALYFFDMTRRLCKAAHKEYARHLHHYANHAILYQEHVADLNNLEDAADGDYNFLTWNAGLAKDPAAAKAQALQSYLRAKSDIEFYLIKHNTDDQTVADVLGRDAVRMALERDKYTDAQWEQLFQRVQSLVGMTHRQQPSETTRLESLFMLQRVEIRLEILQGPARP